MYLGQVTGHLEHEHGKGDCVHVGQHWSEACVIADKTAATCGPTERTFNQPAPRQQDDAALAFGQLDRFKVARWPGPQPQTLRVSTPETMNAVTAASPVC